MVTYIGPRAINGDTTARISSAIRRDAPDEQKDPHYDYGNQKNSQDGLGFLFHDGTLLSLPTAGRITIKTPHQPERPVELRATGLDT